MDRGGEKETGLGRHVLARGCRASNKSYTVLYKARQCHSLWDKSADRKNIEKVEIKAPSVALKNL